MKPLAPEARRIRLLASCPDRPGIVARVATFLSERQATIVEAGQYHDANAGVFFMRFVFERLPEAPSATIFAEEFAPLAASLQMDWRMTDGAAWKEIVLLVSQHDHCLAYLLHRHRVGDLPAKILGVLSNHNTLRALVEWHGIPFYWEPVPAEAKGKAAAFARMGSLFDSLRPEVIVLARYMQILPPWLCERYRYQIINIHHSFLPSFVGARPYHQAEARGVKLIGATCHYVTEELDNGPIIEQDVVRVRHHDTVEDMLRLGKDVENTVLFRGLRYHLEDRILVHGQKTIVFE